MRRSSQISPNPANVPPVPRIPATLGSRPQSALSMTWRDKSLPPIPPTEDGVGATTRLLVYPVQDARPRTVLTYDPRPISQMDPYTQSNTFLAPQPAFRNEYSRRQSFNGLGSQPNLQAPRAERSQSGYAAESGQLSREEYGEFGLSPSPHGAQHKQSISQAQSTHSNGKRRSRFALSTLFGKKSNGHSGHTGHGQDSSSLGPSAGVESPHPRSSGSEAKHEALMHLDVGMGGNSGMTSSGSGHGQQPHARMSMMSQKRVDTLVDQAPEFVAYRYPSKDQNLDLLR